jgi:hypothetical protein
VEVPNHAVEAMQTRMSGGIAFDDHMPMKRPLDLTSIAV